MFRLGKGGKDAQRRLSKAIYHGQISEVESLLQQDPLVLTYRYQDGFSPLLLACSYCNIPIVTLILKIRPDLANDTNPLTGESALHIVSKQSGSDAYEICDLLLKAGALIGAYTQSNADETTPLHYARDAGLALTVNLIESYCQVFAAYMAVERHRHISALWSSTPTKFVERYVVISVGYGQARSPADPKPITLYELAIYRRRGLAQPEVSFTLFESVIRRSDRTIIPPYREQQTENSVKISVSSARDAMLQRQDSAEEVRKRNNSMLFRFAGFSRHEMNHFEKVLFGDTPPLFGENVKVIQPSVTEKVVPKVSSSTYSNSNETLQQANQNYAAYANPPITSGYAPVAAASTASSSPTNPYATTSTGNSSATAAASAAAATRTSNIRPPLPPIPVKDQRPSNPPPKSNEPKDYPMAIPLNRTYGASNTPASAYPTAPPPAFYDE